jgi:trigger factor
MGLFTTASDKVKFKKLKEEGCVISFSVEVPAAKVADESHDALLRIQQRARLPGFRQGKAPLDLVKKNFAGHAHEEVVDRLIRKHVPEALKELSLQPIATPSVEDIKFESGKPLQFEVRVETAPKVTPKNYAKIAVTRKDYPATQSAVDARLQELREGHARLDKAPEEAVGREHYVVIDYAGSQGGKPLPGAKGENELVDMSSEQTIEGLAAGLVGLKRGQSKDVPVKFGGKEAFLQVTIQEIKTKILPAVDAEFAKDLGFETVEALRAKLVEVIEQEGKAKSEREIAEQLESALLKANPFPVPPALVEAQLEHMLKRLSRQVMGGRPWPEKELGDLKTKLRPRAEDEVRVSLLLPAIAEKENLAATDAELQVELEKNMAAAQDDKQKEDVRRMFSERKEEISGMIRDRKAMAFLREKAIIKP